MRILSPIPFIRLSAVAAALFVTQLLSPAAALAGQYTGWGDTGWTEDNQRDCCADAVDDAQDDSANQCANAGGRPKINRNFDHGLCNWNVQGDEDNAVYRCTANATADCW